MAESLFSSLYYRSPLRERTFSSQGSISNLLKTTQTGLEAGSPNLTHVASTVAVLEGIIDMHADDDTRDELIPLRTQASEMLQAMYRRDSSASELALRLQATLPQDVAEHVVKQEMTGIKWAASDPMKTRQNVDQLMRLTQGKPVLVIPMAKSGIAAGFDLAHEYAERTGTQESLAIWPIRISIHRRQDEGYEPDKIPVLTPAMKEHLQILSKGKIVVVFDEMYYSGDTRRLALETFVRNGVFEPGTTVINMANAYYPQEPYMYYGTQRDIVA